MRDRKVGLSAGTDQRGGPRRLRRVRAAHRSSTGGEVHVYEADTALAGSLGTVILTGAITDHGKDHQGVADGGNYNRFVLSKGSFEINVGPIGNLLNFPVNPVTCSADGSATGPIPIVDGTGTGAYQGDQRHAPDHSHLRVDPATTRQRPVQHERDPIPGHRDRKRDRACLLQVDRESGKAGAAAFATSSSSRGGPAPSPNLRKSEITREHSRRVGRQRRQRITA